MTGARWERLDRLFHEATDLAPEERAAYLARACPDDSALQDEVQRLVAAHERAGPFMMTPALVSGGVWPGEAAGSAPAAGSRFGPYRVIREIARGGMGAVYLAERADGQYEQRVALKLVQHGMGIDLVLNRFRAERQILASLEHPNIARLLDGGTSDEGHPYLVMEYIQGEPITAYVEHRQLRVPERLQLFLQVCDAVAYAHSRRVVHRDIKPMNILVTSAGIPKLLDFGIAKILASESSDPSSVTGFPLLTPDYASPEQIAGRSASTASDVYSLGVILYELLTGRSPYRPRSRNPLDVADAVRSQIAERPSAAASSRVVASKLRGDLDTIVLTALQKEPDRRYESVAALADDLRRHLEDVPIAARADSAYYRVSKFVQRNRIAVLAAGAAGTLTTLLVAALAVALGTGSPRAAPGGVSPRAELAVLAVGAIADMDTEEAERVGPAVADMLATNLSRVPALRLVSTARMYEVMAQLGSSADAAALWSAAGERAGAHELLEGTLHRTAGGMRLDLRRVDLESRAVRRRYQVAGSNEFDLVARMTSAIAADFGLPGQNLNVQDVTTSSVIAYRFYEEGLRSFAVADFRAAERLFSASLAEDSSFAMAMHYSLLARIALHREIPLAQQDRLLQLANRASDRERLLIRGTVLILSNEHGLAAVAETLAARYPTEPDGHYLLGLARVNNGDFLAAISHLQRVVDLDSLGLRGTQARCRACDALEQIASAYLAADSPQAAERVARNWLRLQPASTRALFQLSASLQALDRNIEALAFYRRGATINPGQPHDAVYPALFRIRTGDFRDADRELGELSREATPDVAGDALWFLTISLRNQGRLREALTTVDELATRAIKSGTAAAQLRAQVLFEMGRSGQAAALFDSIARVPVAHFSEPYLARHRAWNLTHQATALAALGDTAALTVLTDSIRMWGRRSGFGRDWRLHHHSRGLLLATRGQLQAAAQEFRRAIYSPTSGYTRTNLELARVLMARKQAGEAVVVLRAALRGGLEASNLYVTRTELQEELGRAWEAAGERDSAAVQYRRVLHAWQQADPLLHARRARVAARLKALDVPAAARTRS